MRLNRLRWPGRPLCLPGRRPCGLSFRTRWRGTDGRCRDFNGACLDRSCEEYPACVRSTPRVRRRWSLCITPFKACVLTARTCACIAPSSRAPSYRAITHPVHRCIVGGVNLLSSAATHHALNAAQMLSPTGSSHAFDRRVSPSLSLAKVTLSFWRSGVSGERLRARRRMCRVCTASLGGCVSFRSVSNSISCTR